MSNSMTILAIMATALGGYFIIMRASDQLGNNVDAVLAGVVHGVPMSTKERSLRLYMFVTQLGATVGVTVIAAFGFLLLGTDADHSGVGTLAYLCALLAAFAPATWLVLGPWYLVHCVRVLRQAEAD